MRAPASAFLLVLAACSDHNFSDKLDVVVPGLDTDVALDPPAQVDDPVGATPDGGEPDATTPDEADPVDDTVVPPGSDPPDDQDDVPVLDTDPVADTAGVDPPGGPPPQTVPLDCPDGIQVAWSGGELRRLSHDSGPDWGVIAVDFAGWYHVYDVSVAESGASQMNESAYVRVHNDLAPDGFPQTANCERDLVVVDPDNAGPVSGAVLLGTFLLDQGDNHVALHHFCPRFRAGGCPSLHIDGTSSGCETNNSNSVHLTGDALCLVPAAP